MSNVPHTIDKSSTTMADIPVLGGLGETKEVTDDVRGLLEKVSTAAPTVEPRNSCAGQETRKLSDREIAPVTQFVRAH